MLCVACHHTIHRHPHDRWRITADNDNVWFTPPTVIDSAQVPRLGGKARFGITDRERRELDDARASGRPGPAEELPEDDPPSHDPPRGAPEPEPELVLL